MVRFTSALFRIPAIKFRKGGAAAPSAAPGAAASAATPSAAASSQPQMQQAAGMSTSIPDIDLPPRYRRTPLSQEEIDHINGGGIV